MKLIEIGDIEFALLAKCDDTYFSNGVLFDDDNDNVIAFPVYENPTEEPKTYYKVMKE